MVTEGALQHDWRQARSGAVFAVRMLVQLSRTPHNHSTGSSTHSLCRPLPLPLPLPLLCHSRSISMAQSAWPDQRAVPTHLQRRACSLSSCYRSTPDRSTCAPAATVTAAAATPPQPRQSLPLQLRHRPVAKGAEPCSRAAALPPCPASLARRPALLQQPVRVRATQLKKSR